MVKKLKKTPTKVALTATSNRIPMTGVSVGPYGGGARQDAFVLVRFCGFIFGDCMKQIRDFDRMWEVLHSSGPPRKAELLATLSRGRFTLTELQVLKYKIEHDFVGFEEVVEAIDDLIAVSRD